MILAASRWASGEERVLDGVSTGGVSGAPRVELTLQPGTIVGLRWSALPLGAGSVVVRRAFPHCTSRTLSVQSFDTRTCLPEQEDAHVVFEVRRQQVWPWEGVPISAGPLRVQVSAELSVAAAAMGTASAHDISDRALTAASVIWDVPSASAHETVRTPDLSEILAEVVAQAGWVEDSPIALIFRHVNGKGSRWLQAESWWNGLRTPALVLSEGESAVAAQQCALPTTDCPFSSDGTVLCSHPACVEVGSHRRNTCCHVLSAHCEGSTDAACASVAAACAQFGKVSAAAVKLRDACSTEFAECAGSVCSEEELMPLLAPLDNGAESVVVAPPNTYSTAEMTKLMICALQFAATPDIEVTPDSCTSTVVATSTVTTHDTALCDLNGTVDFGVTPGSCSAVGSTATCAYVVGEYTSSGNYQGYGFLHGDSPCATYPCRNGGECTADAGAAAGFACQCLAGYEGDTCEEFVDECASSPCLNGGSCMETEEVNAFYCACALNYRGDVCQHLTGSVGVSISASRAVAVDEVRSAISTMLSRPEEHVTITNLVYQVEVSTTVQLDIGHTLTQWHPNADAQLTQAVRNSLPSVSMGFEILSGGSNLMFANVDEYVEDAGEYGRRLRSLSDNNETAGFFGESTSAKVAQMPGDVYGRKIAKQLAVALDGDEKSSSSAAAATATFEWLDKSMTSIEGAEARNHRVDQGWASAGINTPALLKRGRSKSKKQRAAIEAAQQIRADVAATRRRQMQEADAAVAATKAESTASWSYRLTSDVDVAATTADGGYPALLATAFNDASAWCRESPIDICRRDQIDRLTPSGVSVEVLQITTAVEYEVLLNGEYDTSEYGADSGSTGNVTANVQFSQELWRLGVPIVGEPVLQALPEGTCTHGATLQNSNRAAVHNRCRGTIGSTCSYICDEGYSPSSPALECAAGGMWRGGTCHPNTEILCPASGQWWDLRGVLDADKFGLTVLTDAASATAFVTTSLLVAQEPWSSCYTGTSVSVSVVCATDIDGQYEPCGAQLGIGIHTIVLIASKISDGSEIQATTSFILTVEDQEPPRLNKVTCPTSSVATWMSSVYASVDASDNSGEVRITACTTDMVKEEPTERVVIKGRRNMHGFILEPSAVSTSYASPHP